MAYRPYSWVLLRIENGDDKFCKVFCTWSPASDMPWRANSGIVNVTEDDEHYHLHGHSGSVYLVSKDDEDYLLAPWAKPIVDRWSEGAKARDALIEVMSLEEAKEFLRTQL